MIIVCFQETKVSSCDVVFARSLWGSPFIDWAALDAEIGRAHV